MLIFSYNKKKHESPFDLIHKDPALVKKSGFTNGLHTCLHFCTDRFAVMTPSAKAAILVLLSLIFTFLFVMYGPIKTISDMYITTAMHTSDHQYLARMLYSDNYINEVLSRNNVRQEFGVSSIFHGVSSSDAIELHEITDGGLQGWMMVVDDPRRIDIVPSIDGNEVFGDSDDELPEDEFGVVYVGSGELIEEIAERHNALAAINASGYVSNSSKNRPNGLVIYDHSET